MPAGTGKATRCFGLTQDEDSDDESDTEEGEGSDSGSEEEEEGPDAGDTVVFDTSKLLSFVRDAETQGDAGSETSNA